VVIACERRLRTWAATSSSSVASRPPSPQDRTLLEKKEKHPDSPWVPSLRESSSGVALGLWAASSIRATPASSQS
jgi:hypothetical protein